MSGAPNPSGDSRTAAISIMIVFVPAGRSEPLSSEPALRCRAYLTSVSSSFSVRLTSSNVRALLTHNSVRLHPPLLGGARLSDSLGSRHMAASTWRARSRACRFCGVKPASGTLFLRFSRDKMEVGRDFLFAVGTLCLAARRFRFCVMCYTLLLTPFPSS